MEAEKCLRKNGVQSDFSVIPRPSFSAKHISVHMPVALLLTKDTHCRLRDKFNAALNNESNDYLNFNLDSELCSKLLRAVLNLSLKWQFVSLVRSRERGHCYALQKSLSSV